MNEEEKKKLQELWDFMEVELGSSAFSSKETSEPINRVMNKFEELFSKELND